MLAFITGGLASGTAAAGVSALVIWVATVISGSSNPWSTAPWLLPLIAVVFGAATFMVERHLRDRELAQKRATGEPWAYRD